MIELAIEAADGSFEDHLLSARLGTTRQQVSVVKALSRPLAFLAPEKPEAPISLKIEILHCVSSNWITALPGQELHSVAYDDPSGARHSLSLRLISSSGDCPHAGLSTALEALDDTLAGSNKHANNGPGAKEYLEQHKVLSFVHSLLHALILARPADPFAFMAQHMPSSFAEASGTDEVAIMKEQLETLRKENDTLREEVEKLRADNARLRDVQDESLSMDEGSPEQRRLSLVSDPVSDSEARDEVRTIVRNRSGSLGGSRGSMRTRRPTIDGEDAHAHEHHAERHSNKVSLHNSVTRMVASRKLVAVTAFTAMGERLASDKLIQEGLAKFERRMQGEGDPSDEFRILRQSPLSGRWTLYSAGGKNVKPHQYCAERHTPRITDQPEHSSRCPFCRGNEHKTPDPVLAYDVDGEVYEGTCPENWCVRVIPNIYPLFVTPAGAYGDTYQTKLQGISHSAAALGYHNNTVISSGLKSSELVDSLTNSQVYRQVDAVGYSEVVIESPRHNGLLAIQDHAKVAIGLKALQRRGRVLVQMPGVRQLLYFKQYGSLSGGSLVHPHMQIVTLPLLTPETQNRIFRAHAFREGTGKCSVCHCNRDEVLGDGIAKCRKVYESEHFIAMMPFASNQYRVSIVPKMHSPSWLSCTEEQVEDLAFMLQLVAEGLWHLLDDPDYDMTIFSVDKAEELPDDLDKAVHWVMDVHPRFPAEQGGIEIASGIRVMSGLPEDWAQLIKKAMEERMALRREKLDPTQEEAGDDEM